MAKFVTFDGHNSYLNVEEIVKVESVQNIYGISPTSTDISLKNGSSIRVAWPIASVMALIRAAV